MKSVFENMVNNSIKLPNSELFVTLRIPLKWKLNLIVRLVILPYFNPELVPIVLFFSFISEKSPFLYESPHVE